MPTLNIDKPLIKGGIHHLHNQYLALKGKDGGYIILRGLNLVYSLAYGHKVSN